MLRKWGVRVIWLASEEEPQANPQVIVVYVPYGTPLPPAAQQAVTTARAPLAITAGATGRK